MNRTKIILPIPNHYNLVEDGNVKKTFLSCTTLVYDWYSKQWKMQVDFMSNLFIFTSSLKKYDGVDAGKGQERYMNKKNGHRMLSLVLSHWEFETKLRGTRCAVIMLNYEISFCKDWNNIGIMQLYRKLFLHYIITHAHFVEDAHCNYN